MSPYPKLADALNVPLFGGDAYLPKIPILNLIKRPYYVEGAYRGRHLKVYNFTRGSGKNSRSYHAINIRLNTATDMTFRLGSEGFFSKIGKAIGMQDIQTGDPDFDEAFVVKCNDEAFVHSAFLPEIRQQFLDIKERWNLSSVDLRNGQLHYEQYRSLRLDADYERVVALAATMSNLADAIEVYVRA